MIRHLSRDHEVIVASLVRSEKEAQEGEGLARYCAHYEMGRVNDSVQTLRMIARLPTPTPSSMGYFYSAQLARKIRDLRCQHRFDLIFVHCSSVAQYVEHDRDTPKILDFGDMDSQKWLEYARYKPFPLSLGYRLEGRKLERRSAGLRRASTCARRRRAPNGRRSRVTGPGSAPTGSRTASTASTSRRPMSRTNLKRSCSSVAWTTTPTRNAWSIFCAKVLPRLQSARPGLKLMIVGADPSPAVRRLGSLQGVTVTGSVPDVRPYLRRATLMVAPLNIARGTQNKILEAMAAGVPVVASRVAAGGVDASSPEHFLVASAPEEYVAAILRIIDDPAERRRLSIAGRERMLSHHDWEKSMQRLDGIIARCLDRKCA